MTLYDQDGDEVEQPDLAKALFIEAMLSGPNVPAFSPRVGEGFSLRLGS